MTRRIYAGILRRCGYRVSSAMEAKSIGEWVLNRMGPFYTPMVSELVNDADYSSFTKNLYQSPSPNISSFQLLNWLRENEFYGHMQRRLLKIDRTSMAHSLEVRVPFLDRNIIDFSCKIKSSLGSKHRVPKVLLRKSLEQYLPKSTYLNKKQSFSINLINILRNDLKEDVQDTLFSQRIYLDNIINRKIVQRYTRKFMNGEENNPWQVWSLYSINKFATSHGLM